MGDMTQARATYRLYGSKSNAYFRKYASAPFQRTCAKTSSALFPDLTPKLRQAEHQALIDCLLIQVDAHAEDAVLIADDIFDTGSVWRRAAELGIPDWWCSGERARSKGMRCRSMRP